MFSRITKFRKLDEYEDLEGNDRVEMDITDPAMRRHAGLGVTEEPEGAPQPPTGDHVEGG